MPPPGHTATPEPRVEQISAASDTELATRTQQMRYLVCTLGVTRPQAHALIKAYEADVAAAKRIGNSSPSLSDHAYLDRLMRQAPGPRVVRNSAGRADREFWLMVAAP